MSKSISCTETAKLIRKALKEAFPDVKFSVQSSQYSGGASIRIRYTDGPNVNQVESVTDRFEGSYFDGQIDFKGSKYAMINGEQVSFGADFIFVNRDYSDDFITKALAKFYRRYAGNFEGSNVPKATVEDYKMGRLYYFEVPGMNGGQDFFRREFNSLMYKTSDRLKIEQSNTAGSVISLGNDGYGQAAQNFVPGVTA